MKEKTMNLKVYHGSIFKVEQPNLETLNHRTDFGKGFYTTNDYEQAERWAKIKRNRLHADSSYVNVYEYTEDESLNILDFKETTEEWLKFVFKNRESDVLAHKYDIVKGPVANDNLYLTLSGYEKGIYDFEETIKRLKAYTLVNQVSFHTIKALDTINHIETIQVEGK